MGRIQSYANDSTIEGTDRLIGTDGAVLSNYATKNFTISALRNFIAETSIVKKQITVTAEQLGDLSGTGTIELIEAAGTDKVIVPISAACFLDYNSEVYNFSADLKITSGLLDIGTLATAQLNASEDTYFAINLFLSAILLRANQPLNLFANNTTVDTGDSPLVIDIAYRVADFSAE
jgi:hypothetical protein